MLREFRDKAGVEWLVWDVYPSPRNGPETRTGDSATQTLPHRELEVGWLCFESRSEKRRITPIPTGWEGWDAAMLEATCSRAGYVSQSGNARNPEAPRL